jgi:hypothetical protein
MPLKLIFVLLLAAAIVQVKVIEHRSPLIWLVLTTDHTHRQYSIASPTNNTSHTTCSSTASSSYLQLLRAFQRSIFGFPSFFYGLSVLLLCIP